MPTKPFCEPLESRTHFAAGLDAAYSAPDAAIKRIAGANVAIYQAVPGPGDRTYLLAQRYADPTDNGSTPYLTIVAVTARGKLDPTFGTGGVALTGRVTQKHYAFETPGLLKLDDAGRLYFADDNRVLRFKPDGTTDARFGDHGALTYASADQSVALADIAPVGDGVLIATTKIKKGVQRFAVQRADAAGVTTVWQSAHDTGVKRLERNGMSNDNEQDLLPAAAQFATSRGGVMLARVEQDFAVVPYYSADGDPGDDNTNTVPVAQRLVVTRFDAGGAGVDRVSGLLKHNGDEDLAFGALSVVLSPSGKTLLAQTERQVLQFGLNARTVASSSTPGHYDSENGDLPVYQLLPDGYVYAENKKNVRVGDGYFEKDIITKYTPAGTIDTTFADGGTLVVRHDQFALNRLGVDQLYLGASGRLYLKSTDGADGVTYLALLRV